MWSGQPLTLGSPLLGQMWEEEPGGGWGFTRSGTEEIQWAAGLGFLPVLGAVVGRGGHPFLPAQATSLVLIGTLLDVGGGAGRWGLGADEQWP